MFLSLWFLAVAPYNEELAWARKAALLQRSCKFDLRILFRFSLNNAPYIHQESLHEHVNSSHLELICSKLLDLLQEHSYQHQQTPGLYSLWGACATSCINNEKQADKSM